MKRILVDCYFFENEFQGSRTYLKQLYQNIFEFESRKPNHERNTYFLSSYNIEVLKKEFKDYEFVKLIKHKFKSRYSRLLFEFPAIIISKKIDIAHFQYKVPPLKFCTYVLTVHDVLFLDNIEFTGIKYFLINKFSIQFSYNISEIVLTVSDFSKNQILTKFSQNKKIHVIENAVEEKFFNFKPKILKSDFLKINKLRNYFIYVSRFEPRKNHYNLLKAFVDGKFYENYDLVLIGHQNLICEKFEGFYESLELEIKKRIFINKNGVSEDQLYLFIKFSKVFIYPSLFEGFGIPPLEAGASGVNVICSNLSAMQNFDFFKPFHINPSSENLKKAINEILISNDDKRLVRIKSSIYKKYNWEKSAKKLYKILNN